MAGWQTNTIKSSVPARYLCLLAACALIAVSIPVSAQQTIIVKGKVIDERTKEPVFFANVGIPGTTIGTFTDENGMFTLKIPAGKYDSIEVRAMGYVSTRVPIATDRLLVIELKREEFSLPVVEVRPKENPAHIVMRKVWANKKKNDMANIPEYTVEVNNRVELDLTNLTREAFQKYKWLKPFEFVLDMMDTTSYIKPFLPVFLIESISEFAYRKNPKTEKEYIKAVQISGVKNTTVTEYLGGMYQRINLFKNWISIFDVDFASPLHSNGLAYYKYELKDTTQIFGFTAYRITFEPYRKGVNSFRGEMWIVDSFWTVALISMEMAPWSRINFVKYLSIYQKYTPVRLQDTVRWVLDKDKLIVEFVSPAGESAIGFIGRRTTTYRKYRFKADPVIINQEKQVEVSPNAYNYTPEAWDTLRHEELEKNEKMVYKLVDTIQQVPQFRTFVDIVKIIVTGYKEFGLIEVGPYFSLISSDEIEGLRVRIGVRTTEKLSERFRVGAYIAYGFTDKNVKYGGELEWVVKSDPWTFVHIKSMHDLNLESERWGEIDRDNILALGLKRPGIPQGLIYQDIFEINFESEVSSAITIMGGFKYARYTPTFIKAYPGESHTFPLVTSEFKAAVKIAYRERFIRGKFMRVSLGSKYPIITISMDAGIPGIGDSRYAYRHLRLNIRDGFKIRPKQRVYWELTLGKVFSQKGLPFIFLYSFPGNWTYYYNPYAFNLMAPFEFISSEYAWLFVNYHLRGYILHRIPLLRRLDFREFTILRVGWGRLDSLNRSLNEQVYSLSVPYPVPYVEVGVGIENILKVIRILAIWRVNYNRLPLAQRFGIFGSFYFTF